MSDRIIVHGLEFYAFGGVTEAEQQVGQRYRAHVELELDLRRAAHSDNLADTVSYAAIAELVTATAREAPFQLLESVTDRAAEAILQRFSVEAVTVQIQKLLPPIDVVVEYAAVEVYRRR